MADVKRFRSFAGILYLDDESMNNAVAMLHNNVYKCLYILHDRDIAENGELKKPHIHFILKFQNGRTISAVASEMQISENYIQGLSSFRSYCSYLIHMDEPSKAQYLPQEVCGSLFNEFLQVISKADDESTKVLKIIDYIYSSPMLSISGLVQWVCTEGLYDVFRRSYTLFRDIKKEKDGFIL